MVYQSLFTGIQADKSFKLATDPTLFILKSNLDVPMNQVISTLDTYQDVVFSNVDLELDGDLTYDGQIVTYTGTDPITMTMNLSCSVASGVNNTIIHIGQAQNDVVDSGAESSAKCESTTAEQSLNIATAFIMQPNDTLNLKIKSDKIATIAMNHFQVVLKQARTT